MRILGTAAIGAAAAMAMTGASPAIAYNEPTQTVADDDREDPSTRIVCRREPAPTGSRLGSRRICKTAAEWDRIQRENRDVLERTQNRSRFGNEG